MKNFLSGLGAKLALAAVALTTTIFTSCDEESINVKPLEQPNATATLIIQAISLEDGTVLSSTTETIAAGANGSIAAQTKEVPAPSIEGFICNVEKQTVNIPAVAKGQTVAIPVTFYMQALHSLATDVEVEATKPATPVASEKNPTSSVTNNTDEDKYMNVTYKATVGEKVLNMQEVEAYINETYADARSLTPAQKREVLKAAISHRFPGFKQVDVTYTIWVPANSTVTLTPITKFEENEYNFSAVIEEALFEVPGVKTKKALETTVEQTTESHAGHGHGHGDGSNPGGGEAGK